MALQFIFLLGLIASQLTPEIAVSQPEDVFVGARMSAATPFDTYRIPALCRTRHGSILAFAEGRNSVSDQASNVIVLRRRSERGGDWSPIQVVVRDEPNSMNNPCVLASGSGRVWLMYQRYPAGLNERTTAIGFASDRACRTFLIWSDDEGQHWSPPREITEVVKSAACRSDASGPGIGIELARGLHKGRLVFPFNEGSDGHYDAFSVYSDDAGKTWHRGVDAPKVAGTNPNETQFAERATGEIYLNARNQGATRARLTALSHDSGETWTTANPDPNLPDPICQGSVLRVSFKPDLLAFVNANDSQERRNGTLRLSSDGGETWPIARTLVPGSFAYSILCPLPGNKLGLLYESVDRLSGNREGYRIRFLTISLRRG